MVKVWRRRKCIIGCEISAEDQPRAWLCVNFSTNIQISTKSDELTALKALFWRNTATVGGAAAPVAGSTAAAAGGAAAPAAGGS